MKQKKSTTKNIKKPMSLDKKSVEKLSKDNVVIYHGIAKKSIDDEYKTISDYLAKINKKSNNAAIPKSTESAEPIGQETPINVNSLPKSNFIDYGAIYFGEEGKEPTLKRSSLSKKEPRGNAKCFKCKCDINNPSVMAIISQIERTSDFICNNCMKNVNICQSCNTQFIEQLTDGFCNTCIIEAPKRNIHQYTHKVERNFEKVISLRPENQKILGDEGKNIFKDYDTNSFVINSGGVTPKLFGVELEYEIRPDKTSEKSNLERYGLSVLKVAKLLKSEIESPEGLKASMKRDGTLVQGFEIVSAPADKKYHYAAWRNFFDEINKNDNIFCAPFYKAPGAERGTGCGCHIHISKEVLYHSNSYNPSLRAGYGLGASKLQTFIYSPKNRKFVEIIAGRPSNEFGNFEQNKGVKFSKDHKIKLHESIKKINSNGTMDHRTAVNFNSSNGKTIEFRFFRSTKSYDELRKNIDFVDAICSYCKSGNTSLADVDDWILFYEFVYKNRQDYKYLFKFFDTDETFLKYLSTK